MGALEKLMVGLFVGTALFVLAGTHDWPNNVGYLWCGGGSGGLFTLLALLKHNNYI